MGVEIKWFIARNKRFRARFNDGNVNANFIAPSRLRSYCKTVITPRLEIHITFTLLRHFVFLNDYTTGGVRQTVVDTLRDTHTEITKSIVLKIIFVNKSMYKFILEK